MTQRKKPWMYVKIAEDVTFSSSEVGTVHFHDAGTTLSHSARNMIYWTLVFNFSGEVPLSHQYILISLHLILNIKGPCEKSVTGS